MATVANCQSQSLRPLNRLMVVLMCLVSAVGFINISGHRASAVAWTPASLGSTLGLWLDASDASTITSSGGLVSQWRDKSGNGRHAVQADVNSQPSVNGSAITFSSSNKFMTGNKATNVFPTSVQVTVVFTRTCCGKNGYDSLPFTLTTNQFPTPFDGYNDSLLVGGPTGSYWGGGGFANVSNLTTRSLLSTSMSATKVSQYLNGTLTRTETGNFPYSDVPTRYYVATRDDRYTHFTGEINEIVVTNELSNSDRVSLEAYLGSKWSIAGAPTTTAATTTTSTTTTTTTSTTTTTTVPPTTTTTSPSSTETPIASTTTVAVGQASIATIASTSPGTVYRSTTTSAAPTTTSTTTTVANSRVRNAVLPSAVPEISNVDSGTAAILVNGAEAHATVERVDNQLVVTASGVELKLRALSTDKKVSPLDSEGNLRVEENGLVEMQVSGLGINSEVDVWMFSTPTKIGKLKTDASGKATGQFTIPAGTEHGNHRFAIDSLLPNGKRATITVGVKNGSELKTTTLTRVLIVVPIIFAIAIGLLVPNRLRRRRSVKA